MGWSSMYRRGFRFDPVWLLRATNERSEELIRICGKWTVGLVLIGFWGAFDGTMRGVDDWRSQQYFARKGSFERELADSAGASKWENFGAAAAYAAVGTTGLTVALRRWVRQHRALRNLCQHCGYSLTGNTSGTCPECGTAVPRESGRVRRVGCEL